MEQRTLLGESDLTQEVIELSEPKAIYDLHILLNRAIKLSVVNVRLVLNAGTLAVYVPVFISSGILSPEPTVLALRTFRVVNSDVSWDIVVPPEQMLTQFDGGARVTRPNMAPVMAAWLGISPPRGGWEHCGTIATTELERIATDGIAQMNAVSGAGDHVVRRTRSEVWFRNFEPFDCPAAIAFGAFSLGFIGADNAELFSSGSWLRLSTRRGHILSR